MTKTKSAAKETTSSESRLIGTHCSTAGAFAKAYDRAESVGCTAMQIFVKGNRGWSFPPLLPETAAEFRVRSADSPVRSVTAHCIYLVNLASDKPDLVVKSADDLVDELTRCAALGVGGLVMHPGNHMGAGREAGIAQIARELDAVFARTPDLPTKILLETTAGTGTSIGARFEDLADICAQSKHPERLGVCLDTCHVFAAGYEINTAEGFAAMMAEFDAVIGLQYLEAIHVNDSKHPLNSRKDRHEHIGQGCIGDEGFRLLMNEPRLAHVPMLLETDKSDDLHEDRENIERLRGYIA